MKSRRLMGGLLVAIGLVLIGTVTYLNTAREMQPIFSRNAMLSALWSGYKVEYLEASTGRTLDKQRDNLTTSEGESYTMLRAVWSDDRATFDQSLKFTNENLRHKSGDSLFAWEFGKRSDGSYGILNEQGGNNTASDADGDIALALVFAANRWQSKEYLAQARTTLNDIWEQEVITVDGKPLLVANNLEKGNADRVVVNPSYFSPASYRIFAKVDSKHDWNGLADASYDWIDRITAATALGKSAGLPPDWVMVNRANGAVEPPTGSLTAQYGYDAMRLPWRLALDAAWHQSADATAALAKMSFLKEQWQGSQQLKAIYNHDGSVVGNYESPAVYGGNSGYFKVADPDDYEAYYTAKLRALYDPNTQTWHNKLSYYDDNWAWFGLALHENALPDLSK